ncbi:hypothetical protein KEM60_01084 [Austwickia sp. TVS 96-490-7B]|uniref:Rv3654c family TadE-like protein n=1 Tax=Austwickia sp. TVS 96-490-7B TaxID=2830843 RepID=UPI001C591EC1|nr:Rv3654c family TadE-like protein [Austwickia sp. TVS 96-490-7B]MBW3084894.1 hypothetical protein [Austwickia sp. TVS 96-490-7B]
MTCPATRPTGDNGSGTVLTLAVVTVLISLILGLLALAAAVLASHRAATAADLAALAAAASVGGDACSRGGLVAAAHGATLERCVLDGDDVDITVSVPTDWPALPAARGRAKAGPPRQ